MSAARHRAEWSVAGRPVRFVADHPVSPRPEAVASAFLFPIAAVGRDLGIDEPVDRVWRSNAAVALDTARRWWGWEPPRIRAAEAEPQGRSPKTALCFSGGVDSFHTLLTRQRAVDIVVGVAGFDFALEDGERAAAHRSRTSAAAAAVSATPVVFETDVRAHPLFAAVSWERTHGGALAAVGHLLDEVGTLLISASHMAGRHRRWGSSFLIDPYWSSSQTQICHIGQHHTRVDKVGAIANHPVVRRHLAVCWNTPPGKVNCGECLKCVVTMACFDVFGALDDVETFPGGTDLAARLDAIRVGGRSRTVGELIRRTSRPDVVEALSALRARTPPHEPVPTGYRVVDRAARAAVRFRRQLGPPSN